MVGRTWIIAAAGAMALALLSITLLVGPSVPQEEGRQIRPIDPQFVPQLVPGAPGGSVSAFQGATHIQIRSRTETGEVVQFFAEKSKLLINGELQVTEPRTLIHNKAGGIIEIRAKTGWITDKRWITNLEGYPRLARLEGQVSVAIHPSPPTANPEGPDGTDPTTLLIEMEDAHFDYDLFEISSKNSVRVESREIEFEGRGLVLTFNELHDRIDKLVLHQGEYLRFRSENLEPLDAGDPDPLTVDRPTPEPAQPSAVQYYIARFDRNVVIESDLATMNATTLTAIFLLNMNGSKGQKARSEKRGADTQNGRQTEPSAQQVTIKWSGDLIIDPVDRPKELTEPNDILLSMKGRPVLMRTAEGDHLTADRVSYLGGTGEIYLVGTHTNPLTMNSREMGTLRLAETSRLLINPQSNTGLLKGAGSLKTPERWNERVIPKPDKDDPSPHLPENTRINWTDRLELTFFPTAVPDAPHGAKTIFGSVRSAAFHGDVHVAHPAFDMTAKHIGIGMDNPKQDTPSPATIRATGAVQVHVYDAGSILPLALRTDALTLETSRDEDGNTYPARLLAIGGVEAQQQGTVLEAGRLDVVLEIQTDKTTSSTPGEVRRKKDGEPGPGADNADPDTTPCHIQPTRMVAQKDVKIRIESQGDHFIARAQQITVNAVKNQVELLGNRGEPAHIATANGATAITGGQIVFDQQAATMQTVGPGTWTFRQMKIIERARPEDQGGLAISWTDSMLYNHRSGEARFVGKVEAVARRDNEITRLSAGNMRLHLAEKTPRHPPPAGLTRERTGIAGRRENTERTIERIEAENTGDQQVVFLGTRWLDEVDGKVLTRLRISGPKMVFDNAHRPDRTVQQIHFIGPGTMQYEDYTPIVPKARSSTPDAQISLSGRGVTAVEWKGELLLDAVRNEMRIHENVWLAHTTDRHLDRNEQPVQLECNRLVADLEDTGGLKTWTEGGATQAPIRAITADRGVIVTYNDLEIRSGMLKYTNADQYITITPDRASATHITTANRTFTQADPLLWNVRTGTVKMGRSTIVREQVGR